MQHVPNNSLLRCIRSYHRNAVVSLHLAGWVIEFTSSRAERTLLHILAGEGGLTIAHLLCTKQSRLSVLRSPPPPPPFPNTLQAAQCRNNRKFPTYRKQMLCDIPRLLPAAVRKWHKALLNPVNMPGLSAQWLTYTGSVEVNSQGPI